MSRYATWADEPPIYQKVNALGGTPRPNNAWDQGYNAAIDGALWLIETDPLVNAAADLLAVLRDVVDFAESLANSRWSEYEGEIDAELAPARAAIARATGAA